MAAQDCCAPYLKGKAYPPTPEAVMRSRFTAYVKNVPRHIVRPAYVLCIRCSLAHSASSTIVASKSPPPPP